MPAKSSLRDKNKKLTDFFAQKPSVSVPPAASSSTARRRPATRASTAAIDREFSAILSAPPQARSAPTATTRKRARSPDGNDLSTCPRPVPKPRSPKKPMRVFKPDPHVQRPTAVVYVTSPFRNSLGQQPTLGQVQHTLVTSPSDSSEQIVCSSQSDEAELVLPIIELRDSGNAEEDIHAWRPKTSEFPHSSPHAHEDAMAVDIPPSSPVHGSLVTSSPLFSHFDAPVHSAATPGSSTTFHTPAVSPACLPSSPDPNELPPLPATPEPMDPEAKTAKLIAEIRARAFAANQSSDDEQPREYRELEDSDDDELVGDLPLIGNAKKKSTPSRAVRAPSDMLSSPLSSVPSMFNDPSASHRSRRTTDHSSTPLRTSARTHKPALASRLPVTIAQSSATVSDTKAGSCPPNRKKSKAVNPLHALLREKELEERRGTSCAALRRAEEAVREVSREVSIDSDDELDIVNRANFADEQAAWKAVHEFRESPTPNGSSDEDATIGDSESKVLGTLAGEAIDKILAGDKARKGKEKMRDTNQKMTFGVSLWTSSSDEDMEVDPMPIPSFSGHPIITRLNDIVRSGDNAVLDLILRSGAIAAVPKDTLLSNIPQLLDMALFASSQIADAVYIALRDLWQSNHKVQIPFAAILFVLVRLGASPSILEGFGWLTKRAQKNHVDHETFLEALKRLLAIVRAAGCANAFFPDDVANVVLILVIMGLDPSTTSELRLQLNVAIDAVCNHGATDYVLHDIHEKVSSFAKQLVPLSKARLVSLFASGSNWTRHIARRLAYCLLLPVPNTPNVQALPLEPLILLLSPDAGSCELFDVTSESTDYEELKHYVYILSVALVDVAPYIEEESIKSASSTSVPGSPNKNKKPPVPPLELLRGVLDALQGKIVDTRAAHLDRSRIKAAIQRLTLRIHYDRLALIDPHRRTSTLKAYFSPQR